MICCLRIGNNEVNVMEQVKSFAKEYHKGSNLISSDESIVFVFKIKNYGISLNANVDIKEYITNTLNIESEVNIKDVNIYSSEIKISLMMIDSYMPNLLIYMIKYYYQTGDCRCSSLIKRIAEDDPFGYGESYIYEHKLKKFLNKCAIGLRYNQEDDHNQNDTYSIINSEGEKLKYHVYMHEYFEQYLFDNSFVKCNIVDNISSYDTLTAQNENIIGIQFQIFID